MGFLIVDDNRVCREWVHDLLTEYGDCELVTNGVEAVDAFTRALEQGRRYDAIILDIEMPHMNGHETLERIRQIEDENGIHCLAGTKVLMLTTLSESGHVFKAFRNGCEAYAKKTDDKEAFLGKLRGLEAIPDTKLENADAAPAEK